MSASPDATAAAEALPSSAQENLELIADMSDREDAKVDPLRAAIERISGVFGTPTYFVLAVLFIASWIVVNVWGGAHGWTYVDKPPFFWLQGIVSSNALFLTISVLIRQDRMAQLAEHRAHLDLQINMLTERKVTKALELIASLHPETTGKAGDDLHELLQPADAEAIMGVIKRSDATGAPSGAPKEDGQRESGPASR